MRTSSTLLAAWALLASAAAVADDRHEWTADLTVAATTGNPDPKLAAEGDDVYGRLAFSYHYSLGTAWSVDTVVDVVSGGTPGVGVTEAFVSFKPVPRSRLRQQLKLGAFYPPLSLENTARAWTSPYTASFSAINTWIAEELRTIGAEWSLGFRPGSPAQQRELRVVAAAFCCNDPAGALLPWRGFAVHQRQSRLGDALELPPVPQIQPGMMFAAQAPATEPFRETDGSTGFYAGLEGRLSPRLRLAGMHYDNRADPLSIKDGHYGWTTRFDHLGMQFDLPARIGALVQWLDGTTAMGPRMNGAHVVENAYTASMLLLTRATGRHRWTLRYDDFRIRDLDSTPQDDNSENGHATTLAYRFTPDADWAVSVERTALSILRPADAALGRDSDRREHLIRVELRYSLRPLIGGR